jgi:cell division protein FtsL
MARKSKSAVMEFQTVKRIDNSRLVRHIEPVKLRSLYKSAGLGGIVALFCMFYIYQHFRCIDLSFQLEEIKAKQQVAEAYNGQLKLEIATLRDPRRIDLLARHQLGLTQPVPAQMREYMNLDGAELAAARFVRPNRAP